MISARRSALSGVSSDGLSTTVLPAASAGPSFQVAMLMRVVPRGDRARRRRARRGGRSSCAPRGTRRAARPSRKRAPPAKNRQLSSVRSISNSMIDAGLPQFSISSRLMVSRSASIASATLWRRLAAGPRASSRSTRRRRRRPRRPRRRRPRRPLAGTLASTSPVAGFRTSSVAPSRASTQLPPMKFWSGIAPAPLCSGPFRPRCCAAASAARARDSVAIVFQGYGIRHGSPCIDVGSSASLGGRAPVPARSGQHRPGPACGPGSRTGGHALTRAHGGRRRRRHLDRPRHEALRRVRGGRRRPLRHPRAEFFSMLGPSGCGKTTTLRMIAGFEQPTDGQIRLEGNDVSKVPPYKRNVNTVFQQYALFPHMSVHDNVAFGLKAKKVAQGRDRASASSSSSRSCGCADFAEPQARPALRRPAAARRARPRARELPERAAARRAARRARPQAAPGDAARAQADPARGRHHVHLRDPRSGRGAHDERPDRGHETRVGSSRSARPRRSTTSPRRSSSPGSSAWRTCCRRGSRDGTDRSWRRASPVTGSSRAPAVDGLDAGDAATLMIRPERMHLTVDEPPAGIASVPGRGRRPGVPGAASCASTCARRTAARWSPTSVPRTTCRCCGPATGCGRAGSRRRGACFAAAERRRRRPDAPGDRRAQARDHEEPDMSNREDRIRRDQIRLARLGMSRRQFLGRTRRAARRARRSRRRCSRRAAAAARRAPAVEAAAASLSRSPTGRATWTRS